MRHRVDPHAVTDPLVACLQYDLRATRATLLNMGAFLILDASGRRPEIDAWRSQFGGASVRDVADAVAAMDSARRHGRSVLASVGLTGLGAPKNPSEKVDSRSAP